MALQIDPREDDFNVVILGMVLERDLEARKTDILDFLASDLVPKAGGRRTIVYLLDTDQADTTAVEIEDNVYVIGKRVDEQTKPQLPLIAEEINLKGKIDIALSDWSSPAFEWTWQGNKAWLETMRSGGVVFVRYFHTKLNKDRSPEEIKIMGQTGMTGGSYAQLYDNIIGWNGLKQRKAPVTNKVQILQSAEGELPEKYPLHHPRDVPDELFQYIRWKKMEFPVANRMLIKDFHEDIYGVFLDQLSHEDMRALRQVNKRGLAKVDQRADLDKFADWDAFKTHYMQRSDKLAEATGAIEAKFRSFLQKALENHAKDYNFGERPHFEEMQRKLNKFWMKKIDFGISQDNGEHTWHEDQINPDVFMFASPKNGFSFKADFKQDNHPHVYAVSIRIAFGRLYVKLDIPYSSARPISFSLSVTSDYSDRIYLSENFLNNRPLRDIPNIGQIYELLQQKMAIQFGMGVTAEDLKINLTGAAAENGTEQTPIISVICGFAAKAMAEMIATSIFRDHSRLKITSDEKKWGIDKVWNAL